MELYDVMRTTFAARDFKDQPVDDATLVRLLDNARFAPSGGNRQGWQVIVVKDAALRARFVPLMRPIAQRYVAQVRAGESPLNTVLPTRLTAEEIAATAVPEALLTQLVSAPVVLVVAVDLRLVAAMDAALPRIGVVPGASIYPFVWNILLAARNEGLGGVLTTFLASAEPEVQALLGLPSHYALAAMLPLGYPVRQLRRLKRKPVSTFAWVDRFEGTALTTTDAVSPKSDISST